MNKEMTPFVGKISAQRKVETNKMWKKYEEISQSTQTPDKLSKLLGLKSDEVKKYALKSSNFDDKMKKFRNAANMTYRNFQHWFDNRVYHAGHITTYTESKKFDAKMKAGLDIQRAKTLEQFAKIKTDMKSSVKEMIKEQQELVVAIKDYKGLPIDAVAHLPEKDQAAAIKKMMSHPNYLKYQDNLAQLGTEEYEKIKHLITKEAQKKMTDLLKKAITETAKQSPEILEYGKVRHKREQARKKLYKIYPISFKVEGRKSLKPYKDKYHPDASDLDAPLGPSTITTKDPATNIEKVEVAGLDLKEQTKRLKADIKAYEALVPTAKVLRLAKNIDIEESAFFWAKYPNKKQPEDPNCARRYVKYPKSIKKLEHEYRVFTPSEVKSVLKEGSVVLTQLKEGIADFKKLHSLNKQFLKKGKAAGIDEVSLKLFTPSLAKIESPTEMKVHLRIMGWIVGGMKKVETAVAGKTGKEPKKLKKVPGTKEKKA
ncbi:hypothetical protein ACFLZH_03885 [Patescibacteria group bacterium]